MSLINKAIKAIHKYVLMELNHKLYIVMHCTKSIAITGIAPPGFRIGYEVSV